MNLPNRLTLFRIVLIPLIVLFWIFPFQQFNISFLQFSILNQSISLFNIIVLLLFLIASITDMLDGYIARKYNLITTFGKFADPIADKLLVNTMFVLFAAKSIIPVLPVLLMLARDTIVDGCRMIASKNGTVVAAGILGKVKTVSQIIAIAFVLLNNIPFEYFSLPFAEFMIWFSTFVSLASGMQYFFQLKDFIFESM